MPDELFKDFRVTANHHQASKRLATALLHLNQARQYAEGFNIDTWQFAVSVQTLRNLDVTDTDCRWLLYSGLVAHGIESTLDGDHVRSFRLIDKTNLTTHSCFVLNDLGTKLVHSLLSSNEQPRPSEQPLRKPDWNDARQELCFGEQIIKRFKLPARNQTTVLRAFQEENWPSRIDDPLPPKPGQDPKRRLHDTINSLNRNQKQQSVRFFGDGTGKGVCWELAQK